MFRKNIFYLKTRKLNKRCLPFLFISLMTFAIFCKSKQTKEIIPVFSYQYFITAMGNVSIEEVNGNVFEPNGYLIIKNELIPHLRKSVVQTCNDVFQSWKKIADNGLTKDPPKELSDRNAFLLNGYSRLFHKYFNDTPQNSKSTIKTWSTNLIEDMIEIAKTQPSELERSYFRESLAVHAATTHYNINGQVGAVIGSQTPWAEVYALANGAKHVTTVDYQKYIIEHPHMSFLYAPELPLYSTSYYNNFDFIVSFSSIEHSGLGRYGDPLDPIGDIREMNKIHCMLKPKGLLFLGLPVGVDSIFYNAHRIYGRMRLAMMFEGFRLLNIFREESTVLKEKMYPIFNNRTHVDQHLFVLEKA